MSCKSINRRCGLCVCYCLLALHVFTQVPRDNPYATFYEQKQHWTDQIKWSSVYDVSKISGIVKSGGRVDSLAIHALIRNVSAKGGGVIFFPAGTYHFPFNLTIKSGVVLRGVAGSTTGARLSDFKPATRFEFLKYEPVLSGMGTPHNHFKGIFGDTTGVKNAGLVNIDINRATINFFPGGYYPVYTLQGKTYWIKYFSDNIIIMGIRQNNAAVASPAIPTPTQIEKGNSWQRWPYPFIGNINAFVSNNIVIANCRLNDEITDNFEQPGYVDNAYGEFTGRQATFSYIDHPGICVNAYKVNMRGNTGSFSGPFGPYGVFPSTPIMPGFTELSRKCEQTRCQGGKREIYDNYIVTKPRHPQILTPDTMGNTVLRNNRLIRSNDRIEYLDSLGNFSLYRSAPVYAEKAFEYGQYLSFGDTLNYRLLRPVENDTATKYPLLIYFHPPDVNYADNSSHLSLFIPIMAKKQNREKYPCYVLCPNNTEQLGLGWLENDGAGMFRKDLRLTLVLIDSLARTLNIDKDRIYAVGLSEGGTAAYRSASRYPELYAAVVGLDGLEFDFTEQEIMMLKNTALWTSFPTYHGALSLFQRSRFNLLRLKKAGNTNVQLKMVPARHREPMLENYDKTSDFFDWLFATRKIRD